MLRFGRRSGVNNLSSALFHPLGNYMFTIQRWIKTGHVQLSGPLACSTFNEMGYASTIPTIGVLGLNFSLFSPSADSSLSILHVQLFKKVKGTSSVIDKESRELICTCISTDRSSAKSAKRTPNETLLVHRCEPQKSHVGRLLNRPASCASR